MSVETSYLSLLPPIVTIVCALYLQSVIPSLLLGVLTACLILTNGSVVLAFHLMLEKIIGVLGFSSGLSLHAIKESSTISMFVFLLCLGCLIGLINHSGGAYAYAAKKKKSNLTAQKASLATIALAFFLFIDDYFSTLTVGSVMQSITDHAKMPRIRLAFIVTSLSTTLCAIVPFSSWGVDIIGQLTNAGVNRTAASLLYINPTYAFLLTVPFVLQVWSSIATLFAYVFTPVFFGPFYEQEQIAKKTGNLFGGKLSPQSKVSQLSEKNKTTSSQIDFFLPISLLILFLIPGFLYFGTANSSQALGCSGVATLFFTLLFLFFRKKIVIAEMIQICGDGVNIILPTIAMLIAAWTLSRLVQNDLKTGLYIAALLPNSLSVGFLPVIAYLLSIAMTIGIGSAWATIGLLVGILLPLIGHLLHLTAPILPETAPLFFVLIGAIISGGLIGNQISPIADVTLMASSCSGAHHIDFIRAQWSYVAPQVFSVSTAYLMLGFGGLYASSMIEWGLLILLTLSLLLLFPRFYIELNNRYAKST